MIRGKGKETLHRQYSFQSNSLIRKTLLWMVKSAGQNHPYSQLSSLVPTLTEATETLSYDQFMCNYAMGVQCDGLLVWQENS